MTDKHSLFRKLSVALAAVWLTLALSTSVDAGWYKKAKKAAKKAAHKVEKSVREQAQRSAEDVSRATKKAGGDISREAKRFGGDISRETKRFAGDVSREGKRFAGDISREGKKFGGDISREYKKGLPVISMENLGKGLDQLEHNRHMGLRRFEDNANRGAGNFLINVTGQPDLRTLYGDLSSPWHYLTPKAAAGAMFALCFPICNAQFMENIEGGLGRLGDNVGGGLDKAGDAIFGTSKGADSDKSDPGRGDASKTILTEKTKAGSEDSSRASSALSTSSKGKTKISAEDAGDAPVAIFRAETDTGVGQSSGGSTTVLKGQTSTTGLGSSTESSSGSSGLGGSQTTGKKETTSTQSTGGLKDGGRRGR